MDTQKNIKTKLESLLGLGWTQTKIAKKSGVPQAVISRFVRDKNVLGFKSQYLLSEFFKRMEK